MRSFAILAWDTSPILKPPSLNASERSSEVVGSPSPGGTIRASNEYRACFAKQLPRSEQPRRLTYPRATRFSDSPTRMNFVALEGAGLTDIMVQDHSTTYVIPDVDTLWRGGLGSFALTAAAVAHQDPAPQHA